MESRPVNTIASMARSDNARSASTATISRRRRGSGAGMAAASSAGAAQPLAVSGTAIAPAAAGYNVLTRCPPSTGITAPVM